MVSLSDQQITHVKRLSTHTVQLIKLPNPGELSASCSACQPDKRHSLTHTKGFTRAKCCFVAFGKMKCGLSTNGPTNEIRKVLR